MQDPVYVKVVEVLEDERGLKIQCSMKLVDQRSGEDLDPMGTRCVGALHVGIGSLPLSV